MYIHIHTCMDLWWNPSEVWTATTHFAHWKRVLCPCFFGSLHYVLLKRSWFSLILNSKTRISTPDWPLLWMEGFSHSRCRIPSNVVYELGVPFAKTPIPQPAGDSCLPTTRHLQCSWFSDDWSHQNQVAFLSGVFFDGILGDSWNPRPTWGPQYFWVVPGFSISPHLSVFFANERVSEPFLEDHPTDRTAANILCHSFPFHW